MVDRVTLYRTPRVVVDANALGSWLEHRVGVTVTVEDRFLDRFTDDTELATGFAKSRVLSPYQRETGNTMHGIVRYEERVLSDPDRGGGVLYDGFQLQQLLRERLTPETRTLDHLHIILLDRAIGTWGSHDGRWHKRINVLGQPALLSVPGLYEAPAKPETYYHMKQSHAMMAGGTPPREVLEAAVEEDFLLKDDPRTTDALRGYVLQAYHYLETGDAFCDDPGCMLSNAHYHEALIHAQLEEPALCDRHGSIYD